MVARLLHVIGHDAFVISHANRIHGARARDEVFLVGVFSAKLMRDQVAAVVEHFLVNEVVAVLLPAAWMHLRNVAAGRVAQRVDTDARECRAAAPFEIEVGEPHECAAFEVVVGKAWLAVVDVNAKRARVFGNVGNLHGGGAGRLGIAERAALACGERQRAAQRKGDGGKQRRKTRGYGARFMLARRYLHQSDAFLHWL